MFGAGSVETAGVCRQVEVFQREGAAGAQAAVEPTRYWLVQETTENGGGGHLQRYRREC